MSVDGEGDKRLMLAYLLAKHDVIRAGFDWEIDWQENVNFASVREQDFLREGAWVILSSGLSERVVRSRFPQVTAAFLNWSSAREISERSEDCCARALKCFANEGKIRAIATLAERVAAAGFSEVHRRCLDDPVAYLEGFPYLGPATSRHLAKNLGFAIAKPDRHLLRVAAAVGLASPRALCESISTFIGDPIGVVDLIIWRHATLTPGYLEFWKSVGATAPVPLEMVA